MVDEVGGGVLGAARRARGADAASLALVLLATGHEKFMPAGAAADPCETAGEDAAADVAVEFALHQLRHHLASTCDGGREGRAVMTNRAMQGDVFDVTREVARRQRRAGLGAARQPAVAAR